MQSENCMMEVTRPKTRFKPTLPKKSAVDGGSIYSLFLALLFERERIGSFEHRSTQSCHFIS